MTGQTFLTGDFVPLAAWHPGKMPAGYGRAYEETELRVSLAKQHEHRMNYLGAPSSYEHVMQRASGTVLHSSKCRE